MGGILRGESMSTVFGVKQKAIYDNFAENDYLSENVSIDLNQIPISNENIDALIRKNSDLIQMVHFLFRSLADFSPSNIVVLIFDRKAVLIEKIENGDCVCDLCKINFRKGTTWSSDYSTNPVGTALKRKKITVCQEICYEGSCDPKWSMINVPINPQDPYGIVSVIIPSEDYSVGLVELLRFFSDFISMSLGKFDDLTEAQCFFEQMFGSLAHEIKNILTTVRGFVQLLGKDQQDTSKIGYTDFILSELDRAHGILRNSIFYSNSKEQRVNICKIPDIINDVIGNLHDVIINSNISLDLEIQDNLPAITGDSTQFRQVFLNIIQNAIEAMPNGGTLGVHCYLNNNIQINTVITDTGVGMPASVRSKVFQPFFSTKHGGTGLGLSVAKQVIEQYKGQVFIKSAKNKGTTFTIILPL